MSVLRVGDLLLSHEVGFPCSKSKLVDSGLAHMRPFNIGPDGQLDLSQVYRIPPAEAPKSKTSLAAGDILFNNTNSVELVGKSALVQSPLEAGFSNHLSRLRVNQDRVLPQYFSQWLRYRQMTGYFSGASTQWVSQAAFKTSELSRLVIQVPALDEQRHVSDLLTRAEGIVRLRREAQRKAAELIPAIFIHMFGDPATNPKGWPVVPLRELTEEFRYGTSQKSGPTGVPVLRIPNVLGDSLNLDEVKLVELSAPELERLRLRSGDVLFVRTNGNPDFVGRSAVYAPKPLDAAGFDGAMCVYASYLIRARLFSDQVVPTYLQTLLASTSGRAQLREHAKTSAGQYNINIDGLSSLQIMVPPLPAQSAFVERVAQVRSLLATQRDALLTAQATFNALLAQAFTP